MDTNYVNMEVPFDKEGRTHLTKKVLAFQEGVREIKEHGQMPEGLFSNCSNLTKSYAHTAQLEYTPPPVTTGTTPTYKKLKFTLVQVLQLEAYFYQRTRLPSEKQIMAWAAELNLDKDDITIWFKNKWLAKLKYESRVDFQRKADEWASKFNFAEDAGGEGGREVTLNVAVENGETPSNVPAISRRPINPDILSSSLGHQPVDLVTTDDDPDFVIEYDNLDPEDFDYACARAGKKAVEVVVEEANEDEILIDENFLASELDDTISNHSSTPD